MNIPINFQVDTVTHIYGYGWIVRAAALSAEFTGTFCLLWFNDILFTINMDVV